MNLAKALVFELLDLAVKKREEQIGRPLRVGDEFRVGANDFVVDEIAIPSVLRLDSPRRVRLRRPSDGKWFDVEVSVRD